MTCPSCRAPTPDAQPFCAHCGTRLASADASDNAATRTAPRPPPEALESGTTFAGRYQIIEELGRGGMGRVYKVIDKEVHAKVALKLIRPEIAFDEPTIDRFRQELTTARGISHKNICRMYDLGRDGSTYFLTMEYVPGEDLKSMIGMSGQLGVGTAISIAKQVCDGLAEAHRLGVVHRDLKPQNIQIDKGGHAKIMDFGIARSVRARGLSDAGLAIGTSQYMSPEQAEAREVDARSDLYALGVVLYEMLTGRVPFDAETPLGVAMKHKLEAPRDPRELNAAMPADLGALILKCLDKDPARRYQSADEVHADLVRIEHGLPTTAKVVPQERLSTSKQITLPFTMRQLRVPGLVIVGLAALSAGAWWLWPRSPAPPVAAAAKPSLAVLYFDNNTGNASLDWMRKGLTDLIVTDLSQSPDIEVIGTDRLQQILQDLRHPNDTAITADIARQVAERAGVRTVLVGSFIKAGDTIRISAHLQDTRTSKIVGSAERVEGIGESSLFSMIDELTRRIRSKVDALRSTPPSRLLGRPGAADAATKTGVDRGLRDITTASIDAYRYYAQGIDLHERSLERQAIPLFERAISIDPGFAMALIKLAVVENNVYDVAKRDEYARRALENVDRVTLREKYYIEGYYYSGRVDTTSRAIEAYTKAVTLYPDHQSARHNLALVYFNLDRLPESIAQYEELRRRGAVTASTYGNLAVSYTTSGQAGQALEVMQEYVRLYPEVSAGQLNLSGALVAAGRLDEAMAAVVKADALLPGNPQTAHARWFLLAVTGQWPEADIVANKLAAPSTNPFQQWIGLVDVATASLYRGQTAAALALVDRSVRLKGLSASWRATSHRFAGATFLDLSRPADALSQGQAGIPDAENRTEEFGVLHVIAAAQAGLGRRADADATLARLKQQADLLPGHAQQRTVHWAAGQAALARGDAATAIAELEQAQTMLPAHGTVGAVSSHVPIWFALASAYRAAGRDAESARWFQRVADSGYEHVFSPMQYVRSFYFLGTIAEKQGDLEKARQYYQRFLGYWKDGDIDRDRVAEAGRKVGAPRATR